MEVCLVGAGPRGLSVLERLCAQERKSPRWDRLTVHVVDPDPPGSGRVWRPSQSRHLLMNTVASQVTVYTDAGVVIEGPLEEGPSLYQWAKALGPSALMPGAGAPYDDETLAEARDLGPDTYPTRALYGQYLTWVFGQVTAAAAAHTTVRVHASRAVALDEEDGPGTGTGGAQTVVLENGIRLTGLGAVVLAQGHVPVRPAGPEREFAAFAARHGLTYLAPANPADVDLSAVAPGESVLLRGLGLNFFDYMALFTHARGGVFERVDGRLVYRPSGREPRMYAGSRRGVPYQARGDNEKGAHGRYHPRLLTAAFVAGLRARVSAGEPIRFGTELWPLVSKEVRTVYYEALLARRAAPAEVAAFAEAFLHAGEGAEEERVLAGAGVADDERWDWDAVAHPHGGRTFPDPASFRRWLRGYLDEDVRRAREGNVSGPFKAALDLLRDLRNELRLAIDHGGLDADSHRDELDRWYTPLNAYLSIGPPVSRIEEMAALIDAGILDVTGPGLRVAADAHDPGGPAFVGTSANVAGLRVRATTLIEARLPETDVRRTADPLMRRLLSTGQARTHRVPGAGGSSYETGGLAVSERPCHLLDAQGAPHPRRFAYGVPTESVRWVTAAGIRPGVGSVTLEDSDAIAAAVLALPEPPAAALSSGAPAVAAGPALAANSGAGATA
ncbi:FAD/NAD(P)-binding protein [Streptomyces sp. A0958]|uniref:FAD/NAD(P)-binding protein n=1 Tax=Streptomyces sp. A0958 TaxID=2563101 RepID=UPI00109E7AD2|nr:FAD/NAD(P)-binding protein [Streptomyces sp. A0958]THA70142.1 FAD/NAD(P)-binding protein [Streptomyces sp. A0958]